jgi:hypothetical protein
MKSCGVQECGAAELGQLGSIAATRQIFAYSRRTSFCREQKRLGPRREPMDCTAQEEMAALSILSSQLRPVISCTAWFATPSSVVSDPR